MIQNSPEPDKYDPMILKDQDVIYRITGNATADELIRYVLDVVYDPDTNKTDEVPSFKTGKRLEKYFPEIKTEY